MSERKPLPFESLMHERAQFIEGVLREHLNGLEFAEIQGSIELKKSIEYSLFGRGKRFRPALCLLMAEALGHEADAVLPWACAIEMIHTYSLIHDDLPCMDNDDLRRGEPTNHKVFGESMALLAGDALLTEAFAILSRPHSLEPATALTLIGILSKAAGSQGMVGGQASDLQAKRQFQDVEQLSTMQAMKTGALIQACCEGVAVALNKSPKEIELASRYGEDLGLAFQLADDVLDSQEKVEAGSFPALVGLEATQDFLKKVSERAHFTLYSLGIKDGPLHELVNYNLMRKH